MSEDKLKEEEKEHRLVKEKLEEDKHKHRRPEDMPGQFTGRGPQENSALGYDALEDI